MAQAAERGATAAVVGRVGRKNSLWSSALRLIGLDPDNSTSASARRPRAADVAALSGGRYTDGLPADVEPIRALLIEYSGIRPEDVDGHLNRMRDRLWDVYPYSCVGRFRFATLGFATDAHYQAALSQLLQTGAGAGAAGDQIDQQQTTRLLDVGCCVGQVLRKLAFDGVDSARLYGADIEPRFRDLGYELFRDRDKFKGTFVIGDFLKQQQQQQRRENGKNDNDDDDDELDRLDGKMTFIHASSFFHLFTWDDQVCAAARMVRLLDAERRDVMIFGRHVGTMVPRPIPRGNGNGKSKAAAGSDKVYLHNAETWQMLWNEVGERTGTKWKVTMEPIEKVDLGTASMETALRKMSFSVTRA